MRNFVFSQLVMSLTRDKTMWWNNEFFFSGWWDKEPGQGKVGQDSLSKERTEIVCPTLPQTQKLQIDTVQIKTEKLSTSAQLYNRQSSLLPQSHD